MTRPTDVPTICIAGMHRSGTSLTASFLSACGLPISLEEPEPARPSNPKGHFEDRDFLAFHSRAILRHTHRRSHWIALPEHEWQFNPDELNEAQSLRQQRDERLACWGWKEPRTCLFMRAWQQVIPDLFALIIYRPAAEVIQSLVTRGKHAPLKSGVRINTRTAARLTAHHTHRLADHAERHPQLTLIVSLADLIQHGQTVVQELSRRTGAALDPKPIDTVYDSGLIKRQPPGLTARYAARWYGADAANRRLRSIAYAPPHTQAPPAENQP